MKKFKLKEFKCKKHPKYIPKRQPMSKCEKCWEMWLTTVRETLLLKDFDGI